MTVDTAGVTQGKEEVVLVALGGPSSSGKTTVAKSLRLLLPHNTLLIHLDDFYLTDSEIPIDKDTGYQNWDCPEAIDFGKFVECIKNFKQGVYSDIKSIEPTEADLKLLQLEESDLHSKITECGYKFKQRKIILVDGFMLFHDPDIINLFDVKLFFHAPFETLKHRRESRNGYTTAEGFWVDPPDYFSKIVFPAYVKSHEYLFKNGDVASNEVEQSLTKKYGLVDMRNDDTISLYSMVEKSLNSIIERL
ncbi:Nicotinamide riboside kinase [Candida viswanathii]|uniref:Nicotinamide riboside kinase n=1 Tax=Candida viswanathii TaxID=5486 RepID=A0A367Y0X4_9ASCO|nr:Nicotinamide riboside kinase [Candida viswanathii]